MTRKPNTTVTKFDYEAEARRRYDETMAENRLSSETLRELEQHCTELLATYRRAMDEVAKAEHGWLMTLKYRRGPRTPESRQAEYEYECGRAKIRGRANLLRCRAETILAVLEWVAPDKKRDEQLRRQAFTEKL